MLNADLTRLISYAARIKHLTVTDQPGSRRILATFNLFLPGGLLFQNLNTLRWLYSGLDFKYIQMFFSPTLSDLTFQCAASHTNISLLSALAYTCPKLRQVSMYFYHDYKGVASSAVIYPLPRIESLSAVCLTTAGLEYIGRLPTLRWLRLETLPVIPDVIPSSDLFPALRDVELDGIDVTSAPQFFRMCSKAPLKSIYVAPSGDSTFALRDRSLRILFCFSNMTSLSLQSPRGFDISDVTIADAAQAWRRLESLKLTTVFPYTPVPLTLQSLYHLAQYCSHLRSLEMTFDATTIPSTAVPVMTQQQLASMDVANSPLANSGGVARFLSDIFRNLRTITALREQTMRTSMNLQLTAMKLRCILVGRPWGISSQSLWLRGRREGHVRVHDFRMGVRPVYPPLSNELTSLPDSNASPSAGGKNCFDARLAYVRFTYKRLDLVDISRLFSENS
ncbi:hypothetical protein DFH07DRAFT_979202 [Mycena maculata]|uniref:F-box domain-containing protein n=1 Tax=Mycena maculata TaxID=230809 RepID=A0AAD7K4G0_9AGAR|nr:hypothetical protein DFH07DRAFT_979202 [Mycena maculata]